MKTTKDAISYQSLCKWKKKNNPSSYLSKKIDKTQKVYEFKIIDLRRQVFVDAYKNFILSF